jgi:hypothetical protein
MVDRYNQLRQVSQRRHGKPEPEPAMTCAALPLSASRPATSPLTWPGRILSGVIGGFLALDGVIRVFWARALVAPSEGAPTLEASLQIPLGAAVLAGVGLYLTRSARLPGTALLLLCLAALIWVEATANVRSPAHMLFWAYVGALVIAGLALRRTSRT